jgi:fumarylpyruvate hydrolase
MRLRRNKEIIMSSYVIPLWELPAIPVTGANALFPVRRIYCAGRNYAEHAREMGFDPEREPPFFFNKPADTLVANGSTLRYPLGTRNYAYEMEFVVAIGKAGTNIPREKALQHVFGYAVGLDMTRRDLQLAARDRGRPWEPGKAFDQSAPVSEIHPASDIGHPQSGRIWLKVNDEIKQDSDLNALIWSVPELIAHISQLNALQAGDLIFTGTPAGVGPVKAGDRITGGVDGVDKIEIQVAAAA